MTKSDIFRDIFGDVLNKYGFTYKKQEFIRIWGDNILQMVRLETSSPAYEFEGTIVPMGFVADSCGKFGFDNTIATNSLGRGFTLRFNNFEGFPYTNVSVDDNPYKDESKRCIIRSLIPYVKGKVSDETIIANMKKAAELFEQQYLPIYDSIKDFASYFEWKAKTSRRDNWFFGVKDFSSKELAYKAYLDGNCAFGVEYLFNKLYDEFFGKLKTVFGDWELYDYPALYGEGENQEDDIDEEEIEFLKEMGCPPEVYSKDKITAKNVEEKLVNTKDQIDIYKSFLKKTYGPFWDSLKSGDFSWAAAEFEKEQALVYEKLKEVYPKAFK